MRVEAPVLLADDDEDIREVAGIVFDVAGIALETVASGVAAEQALGSGTYCVAVLDQHMSPGSGLEVAATRRAAGDTTPLVLWTADPHSVPRRTADELGLRVVTKVDVHDLLPVVSDLLEPVD